MLVQMEDEVIRIRDLLKDHPKGMTIEEISRLLPLNRTSTAKYLNTLLISGQAEMRTYGRAKVFSLTQRVPMSRLMSLSSDLILILDRERTVTYVNDGFLEFFNLEREELSGKRIDQTILYDYLSPDIPGNISQSLEGKESVGEQYIRIRNQDFFFIIKLIPMVFDEGSGGLAIILEDITELKKYQLHLEKIVEERTSEIIATNEHLEKEMKENRRVRDSLEVVNKKLNLLASVTRHDILNQITAISGYIQLLSEDLKNNPRNSGYLKSVEKAIITIENEITFTRDYKDLGVRPPVWQKADAVIQRASAVSPLDGVRLNVDVGEIEVFSDPFLEKVFIDIFEKTIRYDDKISRITVSFHEQGDEGIITIGDNGKGIPRSWKPQLFEYGPGNEKGFNLFLSYEILSITGLAIRETGDEGKGVRFEIQLPPGTWRLASPT